VVVWGYTSQLFDGGDASDDGLVLHKLCGPNCKNDRQNSGHSNWDSTNHKHQGVVQSTAILVTEASIEGEDFCNNEDTDSDEAERTNLSKDLLQMTCCIIIEP